MARGELNCFFREEAIGKRFLLNKVGNFQTFLLPKDGVCHFQHLEVYHQERSSALGWIIIVRRCCKIMETFDRDWTHGYLTLDFSFSSSAKWDSNSTNQGTVLMRRGAGIWTKTIPHLSRYLNYFVMLTFVNSFSKFLFLAVLALHCWVLSVATVGMGRGHSLWQHLELSPWMTSPVVKHRLLAQGFQ